MVVAFICDSGMVAAVVVSSWTDGSTQSRDDNRHNYHCSKHLADKELGYRSSVLDHKIHATDSLITGLDHLLGYPSYYQRASLELHGNAIGLELLCVWNQKRACHTKDTKSYSCIPGQRLAGFQSRAEDTTGLTKHIATHQHKPTAYP